MFLCNEHMVGKTFLKRINLMIKRTLMILQPKHRSSNSQASFFRQPIFVSLFEPSSRVISISHCYGMQLVLCAGSFPDGLVKNLLNAKSLRKIFLKNCSLDIRVKVKPDGMSTCERPFKNERFWAEARCFIDRMNSYFHFTWNVQFLSKNGISMYLNQT